MPPAIGGQDARDVDVTLQHRVSAVGDALQCGWCRHRFGVCWQGVPVNMAELMAKPGAHDELLAMKKFEIVVLA